MHHLALEQPVFLELERGELQLRSLSGSHEADVLVGHPDFRDQLVAFLDARSPEFCPPLDILRGTAFQREVWTELR